jgi:hypothetical protein
MRRWTSVVLAITGLCLATGAAAQDTDPADRPGRSIELGANGGPVIGLWQRISPRASLGLQIAAQLQQAEIDDGDAEQESRSVSVGPALKLYGTADGPFLPYFYATVFAAFGSETAETLAGEVTFDRQAFGGGLGVGLDWFPVRRISIGGHVGLEGGVQNGDAETPGGAETEIEGTFFNTFQSGIRVNLFF